jgi:hypothetical protein
VVNLTPAELAEVHRRATESGLSASAWLRGRALGPAMARTPVPAELQEWIRDAIEDDGEVE